jgi:hypothetical protein
MDAFEAWNVATGSAAVPIALRYQPRSEHANLKSKIYKDKNFTTSSMVGDEYGHGGTHATGSGAVGVADACPRCILYKVKTFSDTGSEQHSW